MGKATKKCQYSFSLPPAVPTVNTSTSPNKLKRILLVLVAPNSIPSLLLSPCCKLEHTGPKASQNILSWQGHTITIESNSKSKHERVWQKHQPSLCTQNSLAALAKPYTSMSIYTPSVAARIISTAGCWVPRSCNKSRVHTGLSVHLSSCACLANSHHNLLCARQGSERSGCCFLFVALEVIQNLYI